MCNVTCYQALSAFGFHSQRSADAHQTTLRKKGELGGKSFNVLNGAKEHNLLVGLGYIPIIGTFIGLIRLVAAAGYLYSCREGYIENPEPALGWAMIARGTIELLSCGILWLALDLIVSLGRCCTSPAYT